MCVLLLSCPSFSQFMDTRADLPREQNPAPTPASCLETSSARALALHLESHHYFGHRIGGSCLLTRLRLLRRQECWVHKRQQECGA